MYGFKPKSARGKAVPQLADGEKGKPRGFKGGGLILGPGTGTSDSIEAEKRPGTFIMPADSTEVIGPDALGELGEPVELEEKGSEEEGENDGEEAEGKKVPVRLSNGEFELPPEQVQALGEAVLTVLRDATHEQAEEDQNSMPKATGFMPRQFFANVGIVAPGRMDIGQWAQGMDQWRGEQAIADARQAKAFQDQADADQYAVQQAQPEQQRQSFFNGGVVENNVTRDGNSYSGGNVGGSVSINGQAGAGSMSTVPAPVAVAPAPAASATPTATPGATPTATTAAAPAAPMGWAERNAQRSNEVTASSIVDSPERRAAQAKLSPTPAPVAPVAPTTPAVGGIQPAATAMDATKPKPFGAQTTSPFGFKPRGYANGGTVQDDDERARRIAQIPAGGTMPAPPADGSGSTEFTRNVNNGLNALGGMGVVSSVPLRVGQAAKAAATGSGATALPSGIPRLTGPAQAAAAPAADFVAGMGPGATTYANTIPRIGNAPIPVLPGTNAALQQGAQANVMSAAMRTASGANAGATALDSTQRNNPAAATSPATAPATAPAPAAATQSEYGRQMSAVGGALVDVAAWLGKTIVSAPGYGFNKPSAAPAPAGAAANAGAGRGSINPASVNPTQPAAAATEQTNAATDTAAAPTRPPTNEVMPGVYRHGRGQYSDNAAGMGMPANFTGKPSVQNMAAADALAGRQIPAGFQPAGVQPPVVRNSTNDWAARKALENMATAASSITNRPEWQSGSTTIAGSTRGPKGEGDPEGKVAAYKAALANDLALQQAQPGMDKAAMDGNAALQREGIQQAGATGRTAMQEQGANTRDAVRNALTGEELGLRREAQGFQTRAAAKLESLQNAYAAEKDPAKQAILARQIREFQGKEQPARYKVAAGGQQIDANGVAYKVPDRVFNEQTGEFADVRGAAAPAPIAAPKAGEVRNGYRFKGGNPNDQANWTKV